MERAVDLDRVIGRAAELDLIDAARRRGAAAVVIGGAAGVGKTRLAREAIERARRDGWSIEQVLANASVQRIPLAACAGLWAASGEERAETAASRVVHAVRARVHGPTLLVVDDAHLLDAPSAQVIALLARDESITCLLTVRTGLPLLDTIRGLWKDTDGERLELQALSRAETTALATALLGGRVEQATERRLFDQCGGNVLFLRELLIALRANGALTEQHGIWRWTGGGAMSDRLDEIIDARIASLDARERRALELVTFGEPLEVDVFTGLGMASALEALEADDLVELSRERRRQIVRLRHPLFSETVRRRVGQLQAGRIQADLARAVGPEGRRRGDAFRVAVWQLHTGAACDPSLLLAAARESRARGDAVLTEQLARAAEDAGGGLEARTLVAQSLMDRGSDEAALELLEAIAEEEGPDNLRADAAELLAAHLATSFGRVDDAHALLARTLDSISDPAARSVLEALRLALHPHSSADAPALPRSELRPAESDDARLLAWLGTAHADMTAGRFAVVESTSEEMWRLANRVRDHRPEGLLWVTVLRWYALVHCGRLDDAATLGAASLALVEDHPYGRMRAWFVDMLGTLHLLQGDASSAAARLEEAAALRREDDRGALAGTMLALTAAYALGGDADRADAAYLESTTLTTSVLAPFVSAPRADAARLAARDRLPSARSIIVAHARDCAARSLTLFELWAWHDAARYGAAAEAAEALGSMVARVDPPLPAAFAASADAHARKDPLALERAAEHLFELGLRLDAAEALATASRLAQAKGDHGRSMHLAARLATVRHGLGGVDTPTLRGGLVQGALTEREREVAALAVAGRRDADIAEELFVSVRTVHAHLRSIYTKLDISGRGELADALSGRAP